MEKLIEENLSGNEIKSKDDLKEFVKKIQSQIKLYEKKLYDKTMVSEENLSKIKIWRARLYDIINKNSDLPDLSVNDQEEVEGINTLHLLNKQLDLADANQSILEKSSLKLIGLNYSSAEIEKLIYQAGKKLESGVATEIAENRRLIFALVSFIVICIGILIDKFRSKILIF